MTNPPLTCTQKLTPKMFPFQIISHTLRDQVKCLNKKKIHDCLLCNNVVTGTVSAGKKKLEKLHRKL